MPEEKPEAQIILTHKEWAYIFGKVHDIADRLADKEEALAAIEVGKLLESMGSIEHCRKEREFENGRAVGEMVRAAMPAILKETQRVIEEAVKREAQCSEVTE